MFGFDLVIALPMLIGLYALMAGAVITFAGHRRNAEIPTPHVTHYGTYELRYTDEQKTLRDFWQVVQTFSFIWPIEGIAAIGYGIIRGVRAGFRYLVSASTRKSKQVVDRKVLIKLEAEREKLLALSSPRRDQDELLASLDEMIGVRRSAPRQKELTS